MPILVSGVRHKMASIAVRERFALTESEVAAATELLLSLPGIESCAILTTCNRSEIYADVSDTEVAMQSLKRFYRDFKQVDSRDYRGHLFTLLHEDAVLHLFRVASGLDSLILGEGQILGQVKETLATAQRLKSANVVLDKLFKTALHVGKRVRTETGIADKDVSVSRAAFELACELAPDLLQKRVALVGGGKMASLLMSMIKRGQSAEHRDRVMIVNRSEQRLKSLVDQYGFAGYGWDELESVIARADVLFVATGAPHLVLGAKHFDTATPKLVFDISVPRNVDPRVAELPNIRLFNTDDLAGYSGFSPETQEQLKEQAQTILDDEYQQFERWQQGLLAVPTITRLRAKIEAIRQQEATCACPVTGEGCTMIDQVSKTLINKILHEPTVRLKNTSDQSLLQQQADVLSTLFDLNE